jgi:hypothetical protein
MQIDSLAWYGYKQTKVNKTKKIENPNEFLRQYSNS